MRILVLSHLFPRTENPVLGRFVEDQVIALREQGLEVDVVSVKFIRLGEESFWLFLRSFWRGLIIGRSETVQSPLGVSFYLLTLPGPRLGGAIQSVIYALGFIRFLVRHRNSIEFDLIHAHTGLLDGVAALAASKYFRRRFVLSEHTGPYTSLFRSPGSKFLVDMVNRAAVQILAVSSYLKREIETSFPKQSFSISVLGNTFSERHFELVPVPSGFAVGWVGQVSEIKNFDLVLRVFAEVCVTRPEARLLIVTTTLDAIVMEHIRRTAADVERHVRIVNAQTREEVASAMGQMNVLVVSSRVETFSVAALEALACGVPVVSTDCGGPADILQSLTDGLIVRQGPPGDRKALATKMASAVLQVTSEDRPMLREDRGRSAQARFGSEQIGARLIAIYRGVLGQSSESRHSSQRSESAI